MSAAMILAGATEFTFAAAEVSIDDNAISDLEFGDPFAQLHHLASTIGAQDVRQGEFEAGPPVAHPDVDVIERGRPLAHERFAWSWRGVG